IEPRRFNPFLNEGEWDGGIWTDAQIFSPDSIVLDPLTVVNPPQAHFANNWPGPEGLHYHSLMDQPPPIGLNQPVDTLGANEKWWPQRFLNQNNAKPQRGAVEVHDLVLTYSTNNQDAKALLGVGYYASFSADDTLGLPGQLSLFDFWIDPFGQWGGDSAAVSFDNWTGFPTVFSGIHFVGTNAKDVILTTINIGDEIAIVSDDIFAYNQQSYETVPFFIPIFDEAPFGPRSQFFPNPPLRPSLPSYDSWPRKDLIENALPPGQYPRKSDWAQVDRAARLLQQHANNDDPPTAMIGINMVGADDPVVNRISQSFFEEVTVAFWGPDFTPSDLRPLDPNGANVESGVMLYEDSNSGSGLTGGIFNGTANSNFNAVLGADSPVPLNNLEWAGAPEPIDLDGDLIPDDMDGDGDADEDDYAWVLRMRPKDLWRVPISDIRYGGGLGTGDGGKSRAVVEEVAVAVSPMDIPEGGFTEDGVDAMLDEARAEKAAKAATPKALPDGGNEGDDLFVVIRPSDSVRQFEKIRVVIPAKLPSRIPAEQDASIAFSPNVHMPADSLIRRSPDENPVQDWYGHDTLEFNVPTALVSLLAPNSEIGAGIPVAVIGVDASTNRPSSEATPYSSQTLGEGTRGDSTLVVSGLPWPVGALVGDFVIDSEFEPYEIVGNTANVVTLLSGSPREGAWLIARSPTFLEQMIVEIYDEGIDTDGDGFPDEPDGQFNMAEDLASLDFEDPANGVSSGVSIYRDNFFHPNNRRGVFDPPVVVNGAVQYIDLPVRLDDRPVRLGIPGEPTNQIRFVFSSPGTDNVPTPIADQPRLRQWIPDSFGGLQAGNEPDFFVVLRSSLDMVLGDDFRVGIVSWGPNTPTEPDPDTFSDPPPPAQPADEFDVFSEFAWGTRAIGYISFFKEPPLYYWMDEHTAHQEVDISGYNWVRTTVSKNLLTEVITGAQGLTPDFIAEPTRQGRDLPVQFTSLTDPALASAYLWDFGDGITSTDQNPSHSYTVAGLYTVSLTVTDLTGIKFTETKPDYIEILLQPFAEFIASLRDGEAALQVSFLDQSDGGPSGNPVSYLWDFGDGSPTSADPNPLHLYTMAGFYTVELTVTFADGSVDTVEKPQYITVRLGGGGGGGTVVGGPTASLTVADSIAAGDVDRSGHALVPLNDWVPLFNINMSSDDAEAPATRFLQTLTYSLVSDPDPDPGPTLLSSYPRMSDILEYGLFVEGGDPEEDFDGGLDSLDTLLFTWDNTGAPVGFGVDLGGSIQYNLSFIGTGSTNDPQYRVQSGFDENGLSYIVAMRTSATWRDGIDLGYEVLDARMTPFAVNEDGEPADSYSPNFLDAEILEDNPLYTSSFSVYDITAGPAEPYLEAYHNSWITPHTAQIPMVEFSRPRFNPAGTVFDIVAGHFQGMRQLFAVDTWVQAVGIDAHSTGLSHTDHPVYTTGEDPAIPQATLREVNVVFTDIGGDPFAGPGSGGFDPRSGLENFPDIFEDGSEFLEVETAIGRDPGFYGVAIFADTNNNGLFDPPTPAPDGFGVTFTDYHLLPEIIPPEWEYISFPPGGGDPWWKI
ncbi:MAG: PKD domain-containing protein, partial [Candidatus Hydrogenedentes bacterium]|nr:PKD domain-containing protein [Candidatus Hydrogenedentota bacterium]